MMSDMLTMKEIFENCKLFKHTLHCVSFALNDLKFAALAGGVFLYCFVLAKGESCTFGF